MVGITANALLDVARAWLGYNETDGSFKEIIDTYNSHKPLARGYAVQYDDEWCDTYVSAVAIKANAVELIGTECGCEPHIKIFKALGIWIEDGTIVPESGDIILYNWGSSIQPNDGGADHIGYVESVASGNIILIEGNRHLSVARRTIPIGWGYIRGFARPKYDMEEDEDMKDPSEWDDEYTDAVIARIRKRQNGQEISEYAEDMGKEAVKKGLFADGDGDGQIDAPQADLKRQESAVLFTRFEEQMVEKYGLTAK